jgi:hypothetical protein
MCYAEGKLLIRLRGASLGIALAFVAFSPATTRAQSAPARDYLNTPVNAARFFLDLANSTLATAPESDLPLPNNEIVSRSVFATILYSFPLGNKYGGVSVTGGNASVFVKGPLGNITASGLADPGVTFHINIFGAPALRLDQYLRAIPQTFASFHLTVNAPLGSYDRNSPVNVGANRWAFTPLINLSITPNKGVSWIDFYVGGRFFTNNNAFQGNNQLSQSPLVTFTAHYSRNIGKQIWAAVGVYYDSGGETFINHVSQRDAANGFRPGVSVSSAVGKFRLTLRYDRTASTPNAAPTNGSLRLGLSGPL